MRALRIGLIAVLVLAAAGCGASKQTPGGGAGLVPASAPVFISIDSDLRSEQWKQVDDLLDSFPDKAKLLRMIRSGLREDTGIDYERDVKPALGPEIDIVWLDFENGGENAIALTKPKDEDRFQQLVDKWKADAGEELLLAEIQGWTVLAFNGQLIPRFRDEARAGDKLEDDKTFQEAMDELPDDALVKAYASGDELVALIKRVAKQEGADFGFPFSQRPEFIAAALVAEDDGMRFTGSYRTVQKPEVGMEPQESKLAEEVPADAVAFFTFRGGDAIERQLKQARQSPGYAESMDVLEQMLGVRFDRLLSLFEEEVAFYVRPGTPIPEFTLLLEAPDEQKALRDVREVISSLTRFAPAQPCHAPAEEAGVKVQCVEIGPVSVRSAAFDGKVVVTTGPTAIEEIRSDEAKLADDKGYLAALEAAGVPDETTGLFWLDLEDGIPLVLGYAEAADEPVPPEVRANLKPLRSFLYWGSVDGRTAKFSAFLEID